MEAVSRIDDTVLNLLPDGILAVDGSLCILRMNRAARRFLGVSDAEALIGAPVESVMEPGCFEQLLRGGKTRLSDSVSLRDGSLWLERDFIFDTEQGVLLCLMRDATEDRRRQQALSEEQLRIAELADAIGEKQLAVIHDVAGLLGESAVETLKTIRELKQLVLPGKENEHG